jgi:hypothetical protein
MFRYHHLDRYFYPVAAAGSLALIAPVIVEPLVR